VTENDFPVVIDGAPVTAEAWFNPVAETLTSHSRFLSPQWVPYTPVWGSLGAAPVLGTGLLSGRYRHIGNGLVTVEVKFTYGSTSTSGTNAWTWTLPPGLAASADSIDGVGTGWLLDLGVIERVGNARVYSSTLLVMTSDNGAVNASTPFTWNAGDRANMQITYEPLT
jgi:hypothetical protein